jgi:hypothetical protein
LRRAEARVAAFEAEEALLPAERRVSAADALEERFGRLDSLRLAAVRRLLRLPAADLPALALKLDIAVAEQAWENSGSEGCLAVIAADARRMSENAALRAGTRRNFSTARRRSSPISRRHSRAAIPS